MTRRPPARPVAVFGTGSWGTAFATVLADAGAPTVRMWGKYPDEVAELQGEHRRSRYLPDLVLPEAVTATGDAAEALDDAAMVVLAVPAQSLRANLRDWGARIPADAVVVSLIKGLEQHTHHRMTEVVLETTTVTSDRLAVVSGPNIAREIAQRQPAATTVASADIATARRVADACATTYFRPYTHDDVVGAELGGCVKNVIALAVGMSDGLGLGDCAKGAVITMGLDEMRALGVAMGAHPATFTGLAGFGDLTVTCLSPHSRNNTFGRHLGAGLTVDEAAAATRQTAEGVTSCGAIRELARAHDVHMPIAENVAAVILEGRSSAEFAARLMAWLVEP